MDDKGLVRFRKVLYRTPVGKYVRFDEPSNTRVIEVVKSKKWDKSINEKKPVRVRVVGSANGDVVVIKTIQ